MNAPASPSLIGARITRKEDYRFLTGSGQYTDDVALPNQTYAAFVRSPHAHAVIKKINFEKAKKAATSGLFFADVYCISIQRRCAWKQHLSEKPVSCVSSE